MSLIELILSDLHDLHSRIESVGTYTLQTAMDAYSRRRFAAGFDLMAEDWTTASSSMRADSTYFGIGTGFPGN